MHQPKHRHFVALPALVVGLGFLTAVHTMRSSVAGPDRGMTVHRSESELRIIDLSPVTAMVLREQSEAHTDKETGEITVRRGEVAIRTASYVHVHAGPVSAHAVGGGLSVLMTDTETSIIALTVPVFVESGQTEIVIPPGYSHTVRGGSATLASVPTEWVSTRMQAFPTRSIGSDTDASTQFALLLRDPLLVTSPVLRETTEALTALSGRTDLSSLVAFSFLSLGTPFAEDAAEEIQRTMLRSDAVRDTLPVTLAKLSRFSAEPLPETLLTLWPDELVRLSTHNLPLALDALLLGSEAVEQFAQRGFPTQSDLWERAVRTASPILRSVASDERQESRITAATSAITAARFPLQAALTSPATDRPAAPSAVDPVELLLRTRAMLVERGVLQTPSTEVTLDDARPGLARVTSVFKEEQGTLVSYSFSFDPWTDTVSFIERDGVQLANQVSGAQFFR